MTIIYKVLIGFSLALGTIGLFLPLTKINLAGITNYDQLDVTDGYSVDGRIDLCYRPKWRFVGNDH